MQTLNSVDINPVLARGEWSRIVRTPVKSKGHITFDLCTPGVGVLFARRVVFELYAHLAVALHTNSFIYVWCMLTAITLAYYRVSCSDLLCQSL
jgi:hypothetical protein